MTPTTANSRLKLTLEYGGTSIPLVAAEILYACNTVPQATVTIPIGRSVQTQQTVDIGGVFNSGTALVLAKIIADFSGQETDRRKWANGPNVIFEGFIAGIGARQLRESVHVTLTLIGWLADLQFSSMLSEQLTPSQASPYGYSAVPPDSNLSAVMSSSGGTAAPAGTYYTDAAQMQVIAGDVRSDVWSGISRCLTAVASQNLLGTVREFTSEFSAVSATGNSQALAAIDRITSEGSLKLRAGVATNDIALAIAADMAKAPVREMLNSTFWDRIVGHHSANYLFTLIPRSVDAIAAPANPGLRTPYLPGNRSHTILASEYESIQSGGTISQPLKSVIIPNMTSSSSNGVRGPMTRMSGCYTPDGAYVSGRVLFCNPPRFMGGQLISKFSPVAAASRTAGGGANGPNSLSPDKGADLLNTKLTDLGQFLTLYAKSIYALEACRGISLSVVGRLRFDIAPGSVVSVEGKSSELNGATGSVGKTHFGFVTSVSININAEAGVANTAFKLSHGRTDEQNRSDHFSIEEHPLYEKSWDGTWLVEAYK